MIELTKFCQRFRFKKTNEKDGYNESWQVDKNDEFSDSDKFVEISPGVKIRANDLKR